MGRPDLPLLVLHPARAGRMAEAEVTLDAADQVGTPVFAVIPADAVFVRRFTVDDFVDATGHPRLHLTEDAERRVAGTSDLSAQERRLIAKRAGLGEVRVLWPAGPLAMSVADLRQVFDGWADLNEAPSVEAWYATWRQAQTWPTLEWHEPAFLLLGRHGLPVDVSMRGVSEADVARGYLGYVGDLPADDDPLATSMPPTLLASAAARGIYAKMPRVRRMIDRVTGRAG